jgi:carbon storage regulator CsrA
MLILTRRPSEVVCIGSTHRVTLLEVQHPRARVLLKIEQLPNCDCELKGFEVEVALGINEDHEIAPDVHVEVLSIMGNQVRFGYTAPDEVEIDRAEVRERKDRGLPPPSKR